MIDILDLIYVWPDLDFFTLCLVSLEILALAPINVLARPKP